ncbi:hypothetical protein [Amycolatopsis samaneae]|uniref:Uncharacterized protein n=1 Tax=Amycolatopsis samaneae TaxID=664691 RepID=A0ABW5G9G1_9PSEU
MRKAIATLSMTAAAFAVSAALGTAAQASTQAEPTGVEPAGKAPSCVKTTKLSVGPGGSHWMVHNGCSSTVKVKVVLQYAADSGCARIGSGGNWYFTSGYFGKFIRNENC